MYRKMLAVWALAFILIGMLLIMSWFSLIWKNRLVGLARKRTRTSTQGEGIVQVSVGGARGSSSLFRGVGGRVGKGMCRRSHRSMAAS